MHYTSFIASKKWVSGGMAIELGRSRIAATKVVPDRGNPVMNIGLKGTDAVITEHCISACIRRQLASMNMIP